MAKRRRCTLTVDALFVHLRPQLVEPGGLHAHVAHLLGRDADAVADDVLARTTRFLAGAGAPRWGASDDARLLVLLAATRAYFHYWARADGCARDGNGKDPLRASVLLCHMPAECDCGGVDQRALFRICELDLLCDGGPVCMLPSNCI